MNIIYNKNIRKFNTIYRKNIINKIEKLNNKNYYIDIYNIIIQDIGNNYSSNRNGIFVNINILSNECILNLIDYLNNIKSMDFYKTPSYTNVDIMGELNNIS
jgi:hypothetical protein